PATADVMVAFGQALAQTGDPALAQEYLQNVLQQQRHHAAAATALAALALRRNDYAACRALLDPVLIQDPAAPEPLNLLAEFARRCGLPAEATRLREIAALRAPKGMNLAWSQGPEDPSDPTMTAAADEWKPWLNRRLEAAAAFSARCQIPKTQDLI